MNLKGLFQLHPPGRVGRWRPSLHRHHGRRSTKPTILHGARHQTGALPRQYRVHAQRHLHHHHGTVQRQATPRRRRRGRLSLRHRLPRCPNQSPSRHHQRRHDGRHPSHLRRIRIPRLAHPALNGTPPTRPRTLRQRRLQRPTPLGPHHHMQRRRDPDIHQPQRGRRRRTQLASEHHQLVLLRQLAHHLLHIMAVPASTSCPERRALPRILRLAIQQMAASAGLAVRGIDADLRVLLRRGPEAVGRHQFVGRELF